MKFKLAILAFSTILVGCGKDTPPMPPSGSQAYAICQESV